MVTILFNKTKADAKIPTFANTGDAGMDFYADDNYVIAKGCRLLVGTGVAMQIKLGFFERLERKLRKSKYELELRAKSGRALKEGFQLTNGVGTIDFDYRGEIGCIVTNTGEGTIFIHKGQKIMQGIVNKLPHTSITEVEYLDRTDRGTGGFGSTGLK